MMEVDEPPWTFMAFHNINKTFDLRQSLQSGAETLTIKSNWAQVKEAILDQLDALGAREFLESEDYLESFTLRQSSLKVNQRWQFTVRPS